jgi:predicted DNA-binding protein with PD1-like motif
MRLLPGDDLRESLESWTRQTEISAAYVATCVGSLNRVHLRLANQVGGVVREGKFEIVSLVGTLSPDGAHLHLSVADETGQMWGGHVLAECTVNTTAEIVIGELPSLIFRREQDPATSFRELLIYDKTNSINEE